MLNHEHGGVTKHRKLIPNDTTLRSIYIVTGVRTSKPIYTGCRKNNGGVSGGSGSRQPSSTLNVAPFRLSTQAVSRAATSKMAHPRILQDLLWKSADHGGRTVEGVNCVRPLERWDREFQSHSRHGCLCAFILCLCCPVCS
jgi:hypothetical protein